MYNDTPVDDPVIGLSLSRCIAAMIKGDIEPGRVTKIIAATCAPDDERWGRLLFIYSQSEWRPTETTPDFPERAVALANQFRNAGKVEQPRVHHNRHHTTANTGIWVADENQIEWV